MYVPFENLPPESKVWIYQSNRKFTEEEWSAIETDLKTFIDLLDKMNVTFKLGEHIAHKPLIEFKKMAKDKAVSENTIVFNNLVNTIEEWNDNWEVPAGESWHSRFF